ncbi:N-acetylmuramoyl-L-alanine amidase-like domain-containing protein [uncultured Fibrella sp.]|uniref:N-acetylmuramoyl-L-alanine amidase-like domain-containing protein n=1 Tax=uncultured Fibrella sp. TaxID=1284596 RepID=UPI0035CB1F0B
MKFRLLWLGLLASPLLALAQTADELRQITIVPGRTVAETAVQTAGTLLGKPYVYHTLEGNEHEQLVVNLHEFDCSTFIETTLALALAEQELPAKYTPAQLETTFCRYLTKLRYRNGQIDGYASRLHYLSDWLRDNERKGLLQDVTHDIGGIQVQKAVNYMTAAVHKYPHLADPAVYKQMVQVQSDISQQPFYFIPTKLFKSLESKFREGDIVMLTAARPGLDMRHVGYATWRNGRLHLLHASSDYKKVVLTPQPLAEYLLANKRLSGVRVARIKSTAVRMAMQPESPQETVSARR